MADETETQPLALLVEAERKVNPPAVMQDHPASVSLEPGAVPDGWVAPEPELSASERLRAFEDAHFGKNAVRLHGRVERGFGSPFKAMPPEKHQHYAALEKLIATEQALSGARGALLAAENAHEAAGAEAAKFEG